MKQTNDNEFDFFIPPSQTLDNFASVPVRWKGKHFRTAEAVYRWEAFNGGDDCHNASHRAVIQQMILDTPCVYDLEFVVKESKGMKVEHWGVIKQRIMGLILRAKYCQHLVVRNALKSSELLPIVSNDRSDSFWGIGPDGLGENNMGKLWTVIRSEDKSKYSSTQWDAFQWEPVKTVFVYKPR